MPGLENIAAYGEAGADYIRLWESWLSEENIALVQSTGCEPWLWGKYKHTSYGCFGGFPYSEAMYDNAPIISEYTDIVNAFAGEYKKLFTQRLADEADRDCYYLLFSFVSVVIGYAQGTGMIAPPREGSVCDVLVQM